MRKSPSLNEFKIFTFFGTPCMYLSKLTLSDIYGALNVCHETITAAYGLMNRYDSKVSLIGNTKDVLIVLIY